MTLVTRLPNKYVRGYPRHEHGAPVEVVSLGEALDTEYSTDAHFAAYRTHNARRLTSEIFAHGANVALTAIVLDVDCPDTHGTGTPAPESWRREHRRKIVELFEAHPGGLSYETRGGGRVVYAQAEPTVLHTKDDAQEWRQQYAIVLAYLARRFDILADRACDDWQRLFRLPRATRDGGARPENWPTFGDPFAIAPLTIEATEKDVATAQRRSKAFRDRSRNLDVTQPGRVDVGLLYWALRLRGDVGGDAPRGGWICICPNRGEHTVNTDGSDSTVVYAACDGREIGAIACLHGHCVNLTLHDWLAFFSDSELEAARERAGIAARTKRAA